MFRADEVGRADEPENPYKPKNGAFEMDAMSIAPVELPAMSFEPGRPKRQASSSEPGVSTPIAVRHTPSKDPRSNLNSLKTESGRPAYVNHWNQYKTLSSG